jgi:hypothetical protein
MRALESGLLPYVLSPSSTTSLVSFLGAVTPYWIWGLRFPKCTPQRPLQELNCIAMAAASAALRRMMAQDPVLTACAVLSAIGTFSRPVALHSLSCRIALLRLGLTTYSPITSCVGRECVYQGSRVDSLRICVAII